MATRWIGLLLCVGLNVESRAETVDVSVLLVHSADAPTPAQIVEFDYTSTAPPPLSSTVAPKPLHARYLLPFRADGELARLLSREPKSPRAKLEQYVVLQYPATEVDAAIKALSADRFVAYANPDLPDATSGAASAVVTPPVSLVATQAWLADVGIEPAWSIAGGWSLVGLLDSGLQTDHPDLAAFDAAGNLTGGNFLSVYSADVGTKTISGPLPLDPNVDELQPELKPAGVPASCDDNGDGYLVANRAGHGTHVAGLVAANAANADGIHGACRHCGISMMRHSVLTCAANGLIVSASRSVPATVAGLTLQADIGVQIVSMSFGSTLTGVDDFCSTHVNDKMCLAISYAHARDVVMVAASGNARDRINFPAGDPRVVAVGGIGTAIEPLAFWDEDTAGPNLFDACPLATECGSNYSILNIPERQEAVAPARRVLGAIYSGMSYNATIQCGDEFGTPMGDGIGTCSGTSMSAPIYAGVAGIVRSINPLLPAGDPDTSMTPAGVRNVMATGYQPVPGPWDSRFGFGLIQADKAARMVLGTSGGLTPRNRATPLFAFRSQAAGDFAYTTSPQSATAFVKYAAATYEPQGNPVRGFAAFPDVDATVAPRAEFFVLATEFAPSPSLPTPVPLYWMSRKQPWPPGCAAGQCNNLHIDHLLSTSTSDVKALRVMGYDYRGIQGYVYPPCPAEPSCMPAGTEKIYRLCRASIDDCAVFGESQWAAMTAAGYSQAIPAGSSPVLGYAYPNMHSDTDDLSDGAERVLGTNHRSGDTDRDGMCDSVEYPVAGLPADDPCEGGRCEMSFIFGHGFEPEECA